MTRGLLAWGIVAALTATAALGQAKANGEKPAATTSLPPPPTAPTTPATPSPPAPTTVAPNAAAPGPVTATATPVAVGAPPATADEEYGLKMRQLEETVAELKEQIFRSKAKLTLLTEQVQGGPASGAKLVINHKNELGGGLLVTQVSYFLDGAPLWQENDDSGESLTEKRNRPLWDGNIVEGSHTLSAVVKLRGNGGLFQYVDALTWTQTDRVTFTAEPAKVLQIDIVLFEQGNFTTELKDRPKMRFDQSVSVDNSAKQAPPAPAAAKPTESAP
jgi:hypothetical protein